MHHVHADDVAQVFMKAIANWSLSVGKAFHAVSPAAVTLRGYAEARAAWFGREAKLTFLPWPEWKAAQKSEEKRRRPGTYRAGLGAMAVFPGRLDRSRRRPGKRFSASIPADGLDQLPAPWESMAIPSGQITL